MGEFHDRRLIKLDITCRHVEIQINRINTVKRQATACCRKEGPSSTYRTMEEMSDSYDSYSSPSDAIPTQSSDFDDFVKVPENMKVPESSSSPEVIEDPENEMITDQHDSSGGGGTSDLGNLERVLMIIVYHIYACSLFPHYRNLMSLSHYWPRGLTPISLHMSQLLKI